MAKVWIIEGTDHNGDVWVVKADIEETADHIRKMFQDQEYTGVLVSEVDDA